MTYIDIYIKKTGIKYQYNMYIEGFYSNSIYFYVNLGVEFILTFKKSVFHISNSLLTQKIYFY